VGILSIILFLLGVSFLFLGWRWQNPSNEEALTALKGLAYLKREIIRVQDQVHDLEAQLLEFKEIDRLKAQQNCVGVNEKQAKESETEKSEFRPQKFPKQSSSLYVLSTNNKRPGNGEVELNSHLSSKYQEVLKLAANGQRIPEIAQSLFISQDAVRMVLYTQPDGGNNR